MGIAEGEAQVASIDATTATDIGSLLCVEPVTGNNSDFSSEQQKHPELKAVIEFLEQDKLPEGSIHGRKLAAQEPQFSLINSILHFIDCQHDHQERVAIPSHL